VFRTRAWHGLISRRRQVGGEKSHFSSNRWNIQVLGQADESRQKESLAAIRNGLPVNEKSYRKSPRTGRPVTVMADVILCDCSEGIDCRRQEHEV